MSKFLSFIFEMSVLFSVSWVSVNVVVAAIRRVAR